LSSLITLNRQLTPYTVLLLTSSDSIANDDMTKLRAVPALGCMFKSEIFIAVQIAALLNTVKELRTGSSRSR
jgi:hypothetical protein